MRRPAQLTFAVTLLRLSGERLGGAPELFGRVAGGGLAVVGIVWLVPLVGFLFGWRLQRRGIAAPSPGRSLGLPLAALVLAPAAAVLLTRAREVSFTAHLALWGATAAVAALVAALGWPALGRLLVVYGLLARGPVAVLMLAAMYFGWGTHYDALPPGFPEMGLLPRWLWLGLLPQATIWMAFTIGVGALCGVLGFEVARRREG